MKDFIKIDPYVLKSVLKDLERADRIASKMANVGYRGKYSEENTEALTIACQVSAARAELIGYLSDEDYEKLKM